MHHKLKLFGFVNFKAMFGCVDNIMYSMTYGKLFILRWIIDWVVEILKVIIRASSIIGNDPLGNSALKG